MPWLRKLKKFPFEHIWKKRINGRMGLGADMKEWYKTADILERVENARDDRIYRLKDAMRLGVPNRTIQKLTKIDCENYSVTSEGLFRYTLVEG